MGEALGIDLRVATCAAARSRDGVVEPCVLGEDGAEEVPAAELMAQAGGGPTRVVDAVEATRGVLAAVAERALGGDGVEAVGVAYALTPDDGPRLLAEQAASAAFGPAFLVPRVVAAAARFPHGGGMSAGDLAVLDVDGRDVEIAVVRTGPDGFDVLGTARVAAPASDDSDGIDMAAHFNEAVSALDLSTRIRIVELLKQLAAGMTLVFVSHDLGVVAALCDEIVILERGRIVESGPTRRILDDPQHPYTRTLLSSVPRMPA